MSEAKHIWRIAIFAAFALIAAAFAGAAIFQDSGMLSLIPPPTQADPAPAADVTPDRILALYQSAFTAWAALILLIPAYIFVWFRTHYTKWLAFWTTSYLAYAVHIYVSAFWFFEGNLETMTTSSRVSAFWPGMVILVWWGVDAAIGFAKTRARWVTIQRAIIHVLVFALFVGGSAVKGETALIQLMGWALLGTGIGALVVSFLNRRKLA